MLTRLHGKGGDLVEDLAAEPVPARDLTTYLLELLRAASQPMTRNDVIDLWAHVYRSANSDLAALPPASEVFAVEVDKRGRARVDGRRVDDRRLREALQGCVSRGRAAGGAVPSAYLEIDDRCAETRIESLEEMCRKSGVPLVSKVRMRKGPWTSRLYRAAKVHIKSLVR